MNYLNKNKKYLPFLIIVIGFFNPLVIRANEELNSTNYKIVGDSLNFGTLNATSSSYKLTGENQTLDQEATSSNYDLKVGSTARILANTPPAPTLSNDSNYYNKLKITLTADDNASDTKYAIAVTYDDWNSTYYLQNDGTLGSNLGNEDYLTYSSLGGSSGTFMLGLDPNQTYKAKVKAFHQDFTETDWGPESIEATTSTPTIDFALDTTNANFGTLSSSQVNETSNSVNITINTNANSGYTLQVYDTGDTSSGGLYNGTATHLITSNDTTLTAGTEGYGIQATSSTATIDNKYDVSSDEVGGLGVSANNLATNTSAVTNESVTINIKAAIAGSTPAGDYQDTIYYTISPNL